MSCKLCERAVPLNEHHLVPKALHNNKWFKKRFSKDDMRSRKILLCEDCHSFLHKHYKEKELGKNLNTLEALLKEELVLGFVNWIKKR